MSIQRAAGHLAVGYNLLTGRLIGLRGAASMPVLDREEYIEQAYFFHAFRERVLDGLPSQDVLSRVGEEILSTTQLPKAIAFMCGEMKMSGLLGPAMARIRHYFTPFQAYVVSRA